MISAAKILIMRVEPMGVWRLSIFFGCFLILCFFAKKFAEKIGWLIGITWLYFATNALAATELPIYRYGDLSSPFTASGGQSLCEFLCITLGVALMNKKDLRIASDFMLVLIIVENILVWWKGYGLMGQTSFDCALIAACVPLAPLWLAVTSIITISLHHGSTAILISMAQLIAFLFKGKLKYWYFIPASIGLTVIARLHNVDFTLNATERLHTYKQFMTAWWDSGLLVRLFGTGSGSFMWISMVSSNFKAPLFLQLHSDWLQIIFEQGLVGGALAVTAFGVVIKRVSGDVKSLAAVLGVGAFAISYHPLRFMPSMLLFALIFLQAFNKTEKV